MTGLTTRGAYRYGAAILAVCAAIGLTAAIPFLRERFTFVAFWPLIVYVSWLGGSGPGLLATALSAAAMVFVIAPTLGGAAARPDFYLTVALFAAAGALSALIGSRRERAETALRESEERFRGLADAVPAMIWMTDAWQRRVYHNEPWLAFAGRSAEEESGEGWASRIHRKDKDAYVAAWAAAYEARGPFEVTYRLRRHDKEFRFVLERGVPRFGPDGEFLGYVGSCTDVTEFRTAEEIARIARAAYQHLFDSSLIGIGLCDPEAIRDANDAFLGMIDCTRDDLPIFWRSARPEGARDPHLNAIEELQTAGACQPYEVEWVKRDGDKIALVTAGARIVDDPFQWVAMVANMTAPKQAVDALQRSEQRLRRIVDSNIIGIAFWHAEGPISEANESFLDMCGRSRAELEAHRVNWHEIIPAEFHDAHERALEEMLASGRCEPFESCMVRPDGSRVSFMCAGAAFERSPLHGVTWIVDITDRKRGEVERERLLELAERARVEAETANRAKDLFLATVSHELRGPLSPILAWARMLRDGQLDEDQTKQAVTVIERSARTQSQIVSDLLDVSRIVAGKLRLRMDPVVLAGIVENAVESVRVAAGAKAIELRISLDAPYAIVMGDEDRIQQIVWNLLSNAVKFTPPHGRVDVALRELGGKAEIEVSDTGQGIEPHLLPRLFERFWQADASTTRSHGGLGLGLSIVRDLSELHGGSVKAESAGPGQGSTFTLTFPRATVVSRERSRRSIEPGDGAAPVAVRLDDLSVLVVDDDPDSNEAVRVLLEQSGAEVRVAASAAQALDILRHWLPDVIVSDIAMPGNDGYMLLAEIRGAVGDVCRVPAIALTAYGSAEDRARMLTAGFQTHVTKPADPAQLVSAVASLAAGEVP